MQLIDEIYINENRIFIYFDKDSTISKFIIMWKQPRIPVAVIIGRNRLTDKLRNKIIKQINEK